MIIELIFWGLLGLLLYIFFGYPFICYFLSRLKGVPQKYREDFFPTVSIIVSAYNEEKFMEEKINNTLELDYPLNKLEVIIASDGSTDQTNELVKKRISNGAWIKLMQFNENRGKTALQNEAVLNAKGEVIVFSDANSMYKKDAIKKLVRNFSDETVGCVCGELKYLEGENAAGKGESLYWRYEQMLKKAESDLGNVLGANGAIYAVRRELYVPLQADIISDFVEPLRINEKGYRTVYEKDAVCYERIISDYNSEWRRKVRIITRSYQGLLSVKNLLNPFRHALLAVGLVSHRLLRWYAGVFLIILFLLNIYLAFKQGQWYVFLLSCQLVFYGMAVIGVMNKTTWKPLMIPAYFCVVNYAALAGLLNYYLGRRIISWKPVR